ncbi:MAG: flagellar basal body-associated FliL family protein [Gemmatimonadetes bacterium]|nr:flagellar basal body-associated FliL family protein [Gemmatimonadota bacterium]MBI3568659.1 flagellar basal body-associated FliL family protein [Gemmatimonadota bacterium]
MAETQNEADTEVAAPPAKSKLGIVIIIAALTVGVGMGAFVAGPTIAKRFVHKPDSATVVKEARAEAEKAGKEAPVLLLDNLVLNPANSGGQRFLLVSVGVQVSDPAANDEMKKREIEARDAVLRVFGNKTVEELSDVSRREGFKTEIKAILDSLLGPKVVRGVYFPQFVIQ